MGLFDEMMLEHSKLNCNADAEVEEIEDRKDSIDPEKSPKKSTQILNEEHDARHYTNGIMDLINEGVLEQDWIVQGLLKWMSEDDVAEFARYYGVADIIDGVEDIDESLKESVNQKLKKNLSEDLKLLSDLGDYEPWSGAVETWDKIVQEDKVDQLDFELEMIYPDGLTVTELNDILWFEPEWVFELLGISNEDDDDLDEACKGKKRSKNKKKIKESVDRNNLVNEVAEFIEDAVEDLMSDPGSDGPEGCWTFKLPWSVLGVCVGWASGFDPDDPNVIHDPSEPEWAIDSAIKVWTSDDLRTDFEWINMPYYKDDGEVWDTSVSISPGEDYRSLAEWFVKQYEEMSKYEITEQGEIIDKYGERTYRVTNIVWDNDGGNEDPLPEEYQVTIEVDPDDDYEDIQALLAYALEDEFPGAEVLELDFDRLEESLTEDISAAFEFDSKKVTEDTVKKSNGKWTNRGDTGEEHGEFKTKKAADAQRKAMYASGYKGESKHRRVKEAYHEDIEVGKEYIYKANGLDPEDEDLSLKDGMKCIVKSVNDYEDETLYEVKFEDGSWYEVFADELASVTAESKQRVSERNLTRSERHNRNMDRIFNTKKEQDKKFADFLRGKGYSEDEIKSLEDADKLNAEIYSKFGGSKAIGDILKESIDDSCYEYKGYTICNDNKRGLWTIKELKDETFSTDKDAEERVDNMLDESFLKEKSFVKLGTDVGHFQELVDYDMERYGRVSVDTRRKIRNAGLSLVTDEYGDVEVIAHDPIDYRQNRRDKFHTREYRYEEEALDPTTGEEIEDEDVDDPRGNRGVGLTRI